MNRSVPFATLALVLVLTACGPASPEGEKRPPALESEKRPAVVEDQTRAKSLLAREYERHRAVIQRIELAKNRRDEPAAISILEARANELDAVIAAVLRDKELTDADRKAVLGPLREEADWAASSAAALKAAREER